MNRLDTRHLHRDLHEIVEHVEDALKGMTDTTGDQLDELKSNAGKRLREINTQLKTLERDVAGRAHVVGRGVRDYASAHPWIVAGGIAALLVAAGALSRRHH